MSKLWEIDPETRSKLMLIQKTNGNDRCCDCGAPSPQWASPKFSTFICLTCAGIHRGLGVHISFVRSISMDAFKNSEILRMENGGNDHWKSFFDNHELNKMEGRTFESSTVAERYSGEVGEEWKERLSAKTEGREYVKEEKKQRQPMPSTTATGTAGSKPPSRSQTPTLGQGSQSPAKNTMNNNAATMAGRKEKNEAYFAKLGSENATRPDGLPPSQGGKYSGFGSDPFPEKSGNNGGAIPGMDEFQRDPMAALTKGFGWFTTTVGKSAKTVNDSYIQPAAKSIAESDFTARAQSTASQMGQGIQSGARGAADSFNKFVEGSADDSSGRPRAPGVEPERKDFWDSFGKPDESRPPGSKLSKPSSIGTSAMRKGGAGGGGGGYGAIGTSAKDDKDDWGGDW